MITASTELEWREPTALWRCVTLYRDNVCATNNNKYHSPFPARVCTWTKFVHHPCCWGLQRLGVDAEVSVIFVLNLSDELASGSYYPLYESTKNVGVILQQRWCYCLVLFWAEFVTVAYPYNCLPVNACGFESLRWLLVSGLLFLKSKSSTQTHPMQQSRTSVMMSDRLSDSACRVRMYLSYNTIPLTSVCVYNRHLCMAKWCQNNLNTVWMQCFMQVANQMVSTWAGPPAMMNTYKKMFGSHSCPSIVRQHKFKNFQQ